MLCASLSPTAFGSSGPPCLLLPLEPEVGHWLLYPTAASNTILQSFDGVLGNAAGFSTQPVDDFRTHLPRSQASVVHASPSSQSIVDEQ